MCCTKTGFRTEILADIALNNIKEVRRKYKREKRPIRSYICEICGYYHLTSKEAVPEDMDLIFEDKFKLFIQ